MSDESDFCMEVSDDEFTENVSSNIGKLKGGKKKNAKADRRTSMERAELSNKYQKKTQLEHIMLRPDTYIGSTEKIKQEMWVFDKDHMVNRKVTYVPGLYKIFDEILVNASDNKQRDWSMKGLKVTIDQKEGLISVWNDGKGIPIEVHREHNVYIPELVFGHLMTGENFEDSQKRVVGGRNGYGAKLANIFSSYFKVETCDRKSGKLYVQEWTNNMQNCGEPAITKASGSDYTCVTFKPDFKRFNMTELDDDTVALLTKRVYDVAGVTDKSVAVWLNGKKLPVNCFQNYIDLYLPNQANGDDDGEDDEEEGSDDDMDDSDVSEDEYVEKKKSKKKKTKKTEKKKKSTGPVEKVYEKINDRWEVCIAPSDDGQMQQVSFVNGIATTRGGPHVNYIADQIVSSLQTILKKKVKGADFKPAQIKNHLWIFVNCLIENPAFDSQTKETLTTRAPKFGPKEFLPKLSSKSLKAVEKTKIVDNCTFWAKAKEMKDLKRKLGGTKSQKVKGIDKLDDANNAGGRFSQKCTLILTEGDSAKTLAISGLSVVGRDYYGVFPLRGKLLNVRDASNAQIMKNEEIQNIMKIMGLVVGKKYTDTKSLRYGHLMIMTDQDHDGSHIKGLLMNFLHHFWPSLLEIDGFLQIFITPIVKATNAQRRKMESFFTMPEYSEWLKSLSDSERKEWSIKYYKGLGTSTAKEAKEYFAAINRHRIDMEYEGDEGADALDMAFSRKRVADRKEWLTNFTQGTFLDFGVESINYKTFVDEELILFSRADLARSIPSVLDGMKTSQRKVLFSCFKRKLKSDIKVAQLVGYVSEHSAYHHGEASLASTIVGMAQTFVGSNNINTLFPSGQFGSRILGGKDAASPRYIFTKLAQITRKLFHESDDAVLNYLTEDGQSIEPDHYVPVIPLILVNGAHGIGTGWSTDIPCYNPRDIAQYIKSKLDGDSMDEMDMLQPWYRGFQGEIRPVMKGDRFIGKYRTCGVFERDEENESILITELPVGTWTQNYKQFLMDEKLFPEGTIKEIRENHTDTTVAFTLFLSTEFYQSMSNDADLIKKFKLESSISTQNMHAYDPQNAIKKYDCAEEVIEEFFDFRMELYGKRKAHLEKVLEMEWRKLDNKARFIDMVLRGDLEIRNKSKKSILEELERHGFDKFAPESASKNDVEEDVQESGSLGDLVKAYNYLLSMALWTLTKERAEKLRQQRDEKHAELERLKATTREQLWKKDLDELLVALDDQDEQDLNDERVDVSSAQDKKRGGKTKKNKPAPSSSSAAPVKKIVNGNKAKVKFSMKQFKEQKKDEEINPPTKRGGGGSKKGSSKVKQEVKEEEEEEEEEEEILSLSERLKARMMVSPAPKKATNKSKKRPKEPTPNIPALKSKKPDEKKRRLKAKKKSLDSFLDEEELAEEFSEEESADEDIIKKTPKPKRQVKRNAQKSIYVDFSDSDEEAEQEDEDDDFEMEKDVEQEKPKAKAKPKSKAKPVVLDDDDDDVDEDEVSPPPKKAPPAKKAPAKKNAAPKKKPVIDDDVEDDEEEQTQAKPRPQRARAPAKKKTTYVESDSEFDDDNDDDDEAEFEADSDFA